MADERIAVTGATGGVGGRVATRLAARGVAQRLVVRDAARAPAIAGAEVATAEYGDAEAMRRALDGVRTLLFVSGREAADRLAQHRTVAGAAAAAGVERVVYTSFLGAGPDAVFTLARQHFHTEQALRSAGLLTTVLRDSLYQDVLPFFGAEGIIRGPAGDGRFAPVARADVAEVAVAALLDGSHDGATYELTGPELLTMAEVATILSAHWGRPVRYVAETEQEAYASRAGYGAPAFEVEGWVTSYLAIAAGELDVRTDHVERITGRPAMTLAEHLRASGV
jgi:NAD(P)H dehydrogenase (quinone)